MTFSRRCSDRWFGHRCQLESGHESGHATSDGVALMMWGGSLHEPPLSQLSWADGFGELPAELLSA